MTTRPTVLLVEDEPAQREVLAYNLASDGFEVLQARTGAEAELIIAETPPDVILLDWMLPELSGIELCRRLKARPETRGIPVIMISARSEEVDRVRGLETGADDYVVKPYSMAELMARVRVRLGGGHGRHVVARMGIDGRRLSRHLMSRVGISGDRRAGRRHDVPGVRVCSGCRCRHLMASMRVGRRCHRLCPRRRGRRVTCVRVLGVCAEGAGGEDQRSEGDGEAVHDAAPSMGRTFTTLNMPACMCIIM